MAETHPNVDEHVAENLVQIDKIENLKFILQEWERNFAVARSRTETKKTRSHNVKQELYQLIGFYGVFQGVIVSAVAQANPASPASWAPAYLSVLASIATLLIVHIKLNDYKMLSMDAEKELADAKVLKAKISRLKDYGASFVFAMHARDDLRPKKLQQYQDNYYWPIMIFLFLFSFIVCVFGLHRSVVVEYR